MKEERLRLIAAIGLGVTLTWISLWLSTKELPQPLSFNPSAPMQSAGFPFTAFWYPQPPMGNDYPPFWMWVPFFVNGAFWTGASVGILYLLRLPNEKMRFVYAAFSVSGIVCWLIGSVYLLLKFD